MNQSELKYKWAKCRRVPWLHPKMYWRLSKRGYLIILLVFKMWIISNFADIHEAWFWKGLLIHNKKRKTKLFLNSHPFQLLMKREDNFSLNYFGLASKFQKFHCGHRMSTYSTALILSILYCLSINTLLSVILNPVPFLFF
jgi:hypothetical protein